MMCFAEDLKSCVSLITLEIKERSLVFSRKNISFSFVHSLLLIISNASKKLALIITLECVVMYLNHAKMLMSVFNFLWITKKCLCIFFDFACAVLNADFIAKKMCHDMLLKVLLVSTKRFEIDSDLISTADYLQ